MSAQCCEGGTRQAEAGHPDGGERWDSDLGDVDVIEANDGDIVGYAEAGAVKLMEHADGCHVVGAHDGCWAGIGGEELLHSCNTALEGVVPFDEPFGMRRDAALFERIGEGGNAGLGGVEMKRTGDESDISVAQSAKVLYALPDAVVIVHFEHADAGAFWADVDEDEWNISFGKLIEQRRFDAEGHDGYAVDLALNHAADALVHAVGVVVGRTDQDLVAVLNGDVFEALKEFGKEGVGDLGDDEAEYLAASGDESSSLGVGEVVEFADDVPHAFGQGWVHRGDAVDGAGDRCDGDVRRSCNRADVHAFGCFASGLFAGLLLSGCHVASDEDTTSGWNHERCVAGVSYERAVAAIFRSSGKRVPSDAGAASGWPRAKYALR